MTDLAVTFSGCSIRATRRLRVLLMMGLEIFQAFSTSVTVDVHKVEDGELGSITDDKFTDRILSTTSDF
jgi:Golgi nucleoside diphosphatase